MRYQSQNHGFFQGKQPNMVLCLRYVDKKTCIFHEKISVDLANCMRKTFVFLIKSHHFPQLPPNSLHDAMIIFRILESSISKTLRIWVRTERNRCFRVFQIVHYTSIFAILCQIIQILASSHKVLRNKVHFLLKFSVSSTFFQSNFARTHNFFTKHDKV